MSRDEQHWRRLYERHAPQEVSWYEPVAELSLALIEEARLPFDAAILDAGGGTSRLAGQLIDAGYTDITVADITAEALQSAQAELGETATRVRWVEADLRDHDFGRRYDLWHDRAAFHFMVDPGDRERYLATLSRSVRPGGNVILATFGPNGPTHCSGLPVVRYSAEELTQLLGPGFQIISSRQTDHTTPSGAIQQFVYAHLRRHDEP
jgi:SAM-dependent methyltransferase